MPFSYLGAYTYAGSGAWTAYYGTFEYFATTTVSSVSSGGGGVAARYRAFPVS